MTNRLFRFALATALVAAAQAAQAAQTLAFANKIKTLGVVVLAGHEVHLARVGVMVFANKRASVPAPDDTVRQRIFEAIKEHLDQEERVEVRRVNVPPDALKRLADGAYAGTTAFWRSSLDDLAGDLAPLRQDCACDALLVVTEGRGQIDPNSNQSFRGLSWVASGGISGDAVYRTSTLATLKLFLVDAASGTVIDDAWTRTDYPLTPHHVNVPSSRWPTEMTALDAAQWSSFSKAIASEISGTLRRPLFQLGFKPSCTPLFHRIDNPPSSPRGGQQQFQPVSEPVLPEGADPAKCHGALPLANAYCDKWGNPKKPDGSPCDP